MNDLYQLYYYKKLVPANNAAHTLLEAAEDLSSEEIQAQFNTNVFGVFRTIREVVPITRRQEVGGTIIKIGSDNSFFFLPLFTIYSLYYK